MNVKDLDKWWSSLTVGQKERIASKIESKKAGEDIKVTYPACTVVWNGLEIEAKEKIHDHCTDKHGLLLPEWSEGASMSY